MRVVTAQPDIRWSSLRHKIHRPAGGNDDQAGRRWTAELTTPGLSPTGIVTEGVSNNVYIVDDEGCYRVRDRSIPTFSPAQPDRSFSTSHVSLGPSCQPAQRSHPTEARACEGGVYYQRNHVRHAGRQYRWLILIGDGTPGPITTIIAPRPTFDRALGGTAPALRAAP